MIPSAPVRDEITAAPLGDDARFDLTLRPRNFDEVVGQRALIDNLKVFVKAAAALSALLALMTPASAQRAPVLRQIKVPHSYYFREMYLPQVTSGPSAVAWSG